MKRLLIILGCLFITSCGEVLPKIPEPSPPTPQEPRIEERPQPIELPPYTESCSDDPDMAELENTEANIYEIWMACLIKNHNDQRRPTMSYHPVLGSIARMRADDLALHEWPESHIDSHGYGPNHYICQAGYKAEFCPAGEADNSIESLSGGLDTELVLLGWLNSPSHKTHVLGEHEYFAGQTYYGVANTYITIPPDYDYATGVWIFISVHPPMDGGDEFRVVETVSISHQPLTIE